MHYQEKFFENLAELSNNPDNPLEEWRYAGGDTGEHEEYFKTLFGNKQAPPHESYCICEHYIEENCYLQNKISGELIVVGNYCIKKHMPKNQAGRTCSDCEQPHKNRKDNFCKDCREKRKRACPRCNEKRETKKQEICNSCIEKEKRACRNCNEPRENLQDKVCQTCYILLNWDDYKVYCQKCNKVCENSNLTLCNKHYEEEQELIIFLGEQKRARGLKMIRFGKHSGRTYEWIYKNEPDYVNWALEENDATGDLKDFQDWCLQQKAEAR